MALRYFEDFEIGLTNAWIAKRALEIPAEPRNRYDADGALERQRRS